MLGRDGAVVSRGYGIGLVDAGFGAPDPDRQEITFNPDDYLVRPAVGTAAKFKAYDSFKRVFDCGVATLLLITFSPLMLLIALAVRMTSRGPALFCQRRLTEGGKVFRMFKFRTMRHDAESLTGPVWAAESDPRVTRLGHFLRLSRLDELPQLVNVIVGDMSLIGPRPERPEMAVELEKEFPGFNRRLAVKGGITGLAQVSSGYAANTESYAEKLSYDLAYVRDRSLALDAKIAARTIIVMLTGAGAR
jgi:lipopolysaccharide/colanic/teichoic acid biosynthesis glycosyltransferase